MTEKAFVEKKLTTGFWGEENGEYGDSHVITFGSVPMVRDLRVFPESREMTHISQLSGG